MASTYGKYIYIDGVKIKTPSDFNITSYNLTKSGRTASGKMTMDLVAKKRKLNFTYNVISGKDMKKIMSLIDGDKMFFDAQYEENGTIYVVKVYVGEISRDRYKTGGLDGWYSKNFSFNLIEQ